MTTTPRTPAPQRRLPVAAATLPLQVELDGVLRRLGTGDANGVDEYTRMSRRRWGHTMYTAEDGGLFLVLSEHWLRQSQRGYFACHAQWTLDRELGLRIDGIGPIWNSGRKAHRYARLLADGLSETHAAFLVEHGLRNTEANRTWAALHTMIE